MASPPTGMKPETSGEAIGKHPLDLPGWLGAARVDKSVEEPGRPGRVEEHLNQRGEGINNLAAALASRESERLGPWRSGMGCLSRDKTTKRRCLRSVAEKRGNARGAKGPY